MLTLHVLQNVQANNVFFFWIATKIDAGGEQKHTILLEQP